MRKIEQTIKDKHLKDLLILEAVLCMSYITVLVKDLICVAKTSISYAWIFMPSSSTVLQGERTTQQLQAKLGADIETFQQHTKVRWLSIGPVIRRVLEQ